MRCTETVVSVQNVLLNGVEDRAALVRSDGDLDLGGVKSELVRGGGRRMGRRCGENLRESNESEEQIHGGKSGGSHLVQL